MGAAYFYHLTESSLEQALPLLLGKALEAGWRIEVRGTDAKQIEALDLALWGGAETGFLPHGVAGGDHDAHQPILLTSDGRVPQNDATCIACVHGAPVSAEEVTKAERTMILFSGFDDNLVQLARTAWKDLTSQNVPAQYWAQEDGRWTKKAESAPQDQ